MTRQPFTRLWLDEVDSGRWQRVATTGPGQTGKSLLAFVVPILYNLFEVGETVVVGLPSLDIASDKWTRDILPVILQTRYRDQLPSRGAGSRGKKKLESVVFARGQMLKFMSGGGDDKSRASFTTRIVGVTEVDGLDDSAETSREANKLDQIEARARAFGNRKRIFLECTASNSSGRIWQEYTHGTCSQIMVRCPHCGEWTCPGRDHLLGWRDADSVVAARAAARWSCPACTKEWTEQERIEANRNAKLLHQGQTIGGDGAISGELPQTDTLGFRWSAFNNLFLTAGDIAVDEWKAARAEDQDDAEKKMCQFVWGLPWDPPKLDLRKLDYVQIAERLGPCEKGTIPPDAIRVTAGIDVGARLCHWSLVAWDAGATATVVDYGVVETACDELGVERGVLVALRQFRDMVLAGWPQQGNEKPRMPDQVWCDSGYQTDVVYEFCREAESRAGNRFWPVKGSGVGTYQEQKSTGPVIRHIGQRYHFAAIESAKSLLVHIDSDYWKTWVHERLSLQPGTAGAMTLFKATRREQHLSFAKHLTAEHRDEEFVAGKGVVVRWRQIRNANHWLDSTCYASAAGHFAGVRLIESQADRMKSVAREKPKPMTTPDGRPYLVTQR